jgi:predicted DNA-binding transcriptional regulator AlpA
MAMNAVEVLGQLLTVLELAQRLGVSSRTVYRWTAEGRLPRPISLTKRSARWDAQEVVAAVAKLAGWP